MKTSTVMIWNRLTKNREPFYKLTPAFPEFQYRESSIGTLEWVRSKFTEYDVFRKTPLGLEFKINDARDKIVRFCSKYSPRVALNCTEDDDYNPFSKFKWNPQP